MLLFQHTAARRRLTLDMAKEVAMIEFQHTAARRRLRNNGGASGSSGSVSTHSRPKAAEQFNRAIQTDVCGFNTQPPEGG